MRSSLALDGLRLAGLACMVWCATRLPAADCNVNGVDDTDDIASGASEDCNGNGNPDECDIAPVNPGTFKPPVFYPTGTNPESVAWADLNSDGHLDLALACYGSSRVDLLLGDGHGGFSGGGSLTAGQGTTFVAAGDLDGDNDADLAIANQVDGTVSVLRNRGDGTFDDHVPYAVQTEPISIAMADLDGDGDRDLAVGNYKSAYVSILLNRGDATLDPGVGLRTEPGQFGPVSVVAADLDGDQDLDLAVANDSAKKVSVFLNKGDATFEARVSYPLGGQANFVAAADLDGDGDIDLATANYMPPGVSLLRNDGAGGFLPWTDFGLPWTDLWAQSRPSCVAIADFDIDGDNDLAVVDHGAGTVQVLQTSNGSWKSQSREIPVSGAYFIAPADFDEDGTSDLAIACRTANNATVILNRGAISGDSNSDGVPDECSFLKGDANIDGVIDVSDGAFINGWLYLGYPQNLECMAAADCDGTVIVDLIDTVNLLGYLFLGNPSRLAIRPGDENRCKRYVPSNPPSFARFAFGFDGTPAELRGAPGEVKTLEVFVTLTTSENPHLDGAQGWSFGVIAEGGTIEKVALKGVTVDTIYCEDDDLDPDTPCSLHDSFIQDLGAANVFVRIANLAAHKDDSSRKGAISAVLLRVGGEKMVLQPSGTQRIARLEVKAVIPEKESAPLTLRFLEGLKGQGQPVRNIVTYSGYSQVPALGEATILLVPDLGGRQVPGDANQDRGLDLSDGVWLLGHLFLGTPGTESLPCEGGSASSPGPGELALVDSNGDGSIDLSDAVSVLRFLFMGGQAHPLGTQCVPIPGCPEKCQ